MGTVKGISLMIKISRFLSCVLIGSLCAGLHAAGPPQQVQDLSRSSYKIFLDSSVVLDTQNIIATSEKVDVIGDYKYSLDKSLADSAVGQNAVIGNSMKIVQDIGSGIKGITDGKIFVEHAKTANGETIASDYSLTVVSKFPLINRVVVQVRDLSKIKMVREELELDYRVVSTELDIMYGNAVLQ